VSWIAGIAFVNFYDDNSFEASFDLIYAEIVKIIIPLRKHKTPVESLPITPITFEIEKTIESIRSNVIVVVCMDLYVLNFKNEISFILNLLI
jgi:hypothetical protein